MHLQPTRCRTIGICHLAQHQPVCSSTLCGEAACGLEIVRCNRGLPRPPKPKKQGAVKLQEFNVAPSFPMMVGSWPLLRDLNLSRGYVENWEVPYLANIEIERCHGLNRLANVFFILMHFSWKVTSTKTEKCFCWMIFSTWPPKKTSKGTVMEHHLKSQSWPVATRLMCFHTKSTICIYKQKKNIWESGLLVLARGAVGKVLWIARSCVQIAPSTNRHDILG